jgi:DNA-3-methyladenine glycosylase II
MPVGSVYGQPGNLSFAFVGLARQLASGDLDSSAGPPNDEVRERLTAVRGFGRWGAERLVARSLGRGDVHPAGDLAVRGAAAGGGA